MDFYKYHGLGNDYIVIDRRALKIEIWERGAGYTLASGSSSCAKVCAAEGNFTPEFRKHLAGG